MTGPDERYGNGSVGSTLGRMLYVLGVLVLMCLFFVAWWGGWDLLPAVLLLVPPVLVLVFIGFKMT